MNSENFQNHQIFEKISTLEEQLNSKELTEKIEIEKISFFKDAIVFINQRLNLTIPNLTQETDVDSVSTELQNVNSYLSTFISNGNVVYINNAIASINTAISKVKTFPIAINDRNFNFSRKIADFEKTILEKYSIIKSRNDELESEIKKIEEKLTAKETEIQRLNSLIEGKETQIQNLNSTFETNFENIRSLTTQDLQNDKVAFRREIDNEKAEYRAEIDELKTEIEASSTQTINSLNSKLEEAKKIVNVISNVGVTGNYQLIANQHKKNADLWRWIAVGIMATFSGLLIWTIIDLSQSTFDWHKSLLRIIAAAALTYPATYAAKESTKHRNLENTNRTAELELASVDTFIEMLDDTKKQEIKEKLVEKYFGNSNHNFSEFELKKDDEQLTIGAFEKLLNLLSKFTK